ncbi:MAG: hypothetical protein PVF53_23150 [Desulfobacterales bacterium]
MQKNSIIRSCGLLGLILIFIFGLFQLFVLGFKTGDIYPAYSSLRSDPLGTRALYESLKKFDHITVQRNYQPIRLATLEPKTTMLYLGAAESNWYSIPAALMDVVDRLIQKEGRLVLSFLPTHTIPTKSKDKKFADSKRSDSVETKRPRHDGIRDSGLADKTETERSVEKESVLPKIKQPQAHKEEKQKTSISVKQHWGISLEFNDSAVNKEGKSLDLVAISHHADLPGAISWHTNLYFQILDPGWKILYSSDGYPVIIEKAYGEGSIILSADSYIFSNEALRSERHPNLILRLIGRNSNIVFDEAHLGLYERPGVASLIRHYRFYWFFAALGVLAILFVWKNAVYFVPPHQEVVASDNNVISAKDDTQGLIALLRRNITFKAIIAICVQEWERAFKNEQRILPETFERINNVINGEETAIKKQTDPVKEYHTIRKIISKDKRNE